MGSIWLLRVMTSSLETCSNLMAHLMRTKGTRLGLFPLIVTCILGGGVSPHTPLPCCLFLTSNRVAQFISTTLSGVFIGRCIFGECAVSSPCLKRSTLLLTSLGHCPKMELICSSFSDLTIARLLLLGNIPHTCWVQVQLCSTFWWHHSCKTHH